MELIDKQKAIEAIEGMIIPDPYHECNKNHGHDEHNMAIADCVATIEALPSAADVPDTNVGELISRQAAIKDAESWVAVDGYEKHLQKNVVEWLKELPSAQPQIIYCKDCKHWIPYDWMFSEVWQSKNIADYPEDEIGCDCCDMAMKANDFCSYAERRGVTE